MNRTFKKVLSFVLALAMVVLATVPAFATGVVVPAPTNDKEIKFSVTKGGIKTNVATGDFTLSADTTVANPATGEYELTDSKNVGLNRNTVYTVELAINDVEEGTPSKFVISTNANGKIDQIRAITFDVDENGVVKKDAAGKWLIKNDAALTIEKDAKSLFEFKLANSAVDNDYTLYARRPNGEAVTTAPTTVNVYKVKTTTDADGKTVYQYADNKAVNQVDYTAKIGGFVIQKGENTPGQKKVDSAREITKAESATLETLAAAKDTPRLGIVAIVEAGPDKTFNTEDDAVVFTDFSTDKQAVITVPGANDPTVVANFKVKVVGLNNPNKAVEGATVEIQKNSTKLFGEESFGEAIATGKTDKYGEVTFENVKVADLLKYLSDGQITADKDYDDAFNEIRLPFRAIVTTADGYQVPDYRVITGADVKAKELTIELTPGDSGKLINRIKGENRFETSVEAAKALYPKAADLGAKLTATTGDALAQNGAKNVIIANGLRFPDALAGNGLTKYYDAPILLTNGTTIDPSVEKFIKDYEVKNVIILGGTDAVAGSVETSFEKQGLTTTRLKGENRYETAAAIAERIALFNEGEIKEALIASGEDFADALVASVPAAVYGTPILLTAKNSVPAATAEAIKEFKVAKATVIGGDAAISDTTYGQLNIATKERVYGTNRQVTSMKVADKFFPQAGSAYVAGGMNFSDALVGGALAANKKAPILLTNEKELTKEVADYITTHKITDVTILGGTAAVTAAVETALEKAVLEASK